VSSGSEPPDPLIGAVIADRYRVVRRLDRGGMGTIYEVAHLRLPRSFAMKRLVGGGDEAALARFRREADLVAALRHPNIVEVVGWEALDDGTPCLIMELLVGEDMHARITRDGPLDWEAIARFGDEILAALAVSHRAGIVHRDVKPRNVFLARDDAGGERAKLLDFGVSKLRHGGGGAGPESTGARRMGTPLYMSPEQARGGGGDDVGPESDVWAMGAILYEAACARPAFAAGDTPAVLHRICYEPPAPLASLRRDAPAEFVALVEDALSRDPERRIVTVEEQRERLRDCFAHGPVETAARGRRAPLVAGALALVAAVALAAALLGARRGDRPAAVAPSPSETRAPAPPSETRTPAPTVRAPASTVHAPVAAPAPPQPVSHRAPPPRRPLAPRSASAPIAPSPEPPLERLPEPPRPTGPPGPLDP
jgi:serine/threonine-protein kinase